MIESLGTANGTSYFSNIEQVEGGFKGQLINSSQTVVLETNELYTNEDMCKAYIQDKFNEIKFKPVVASTNR